MALSVVKVPPEIAAFGKEPCCFCFKQTNFWYNKNDVAVCLSCADEKNPNDVPSKTAWCAAVMRRMVNDKPRLCV